MTAPKLKVTAREKATHELNTKRAAGMVPAVMYGNKKKPEMYWVEYLPFEKIYRSAGESTILELSVGSDKSLNVLIHEVQRDPLSSRFTHVDFYQVNMSEEIETDVPLEFVGESVAVKGLGGILVKSLDEVKVKCLPKDLPHALTIDISVLETFDHVIKVADLVLPAGVTMLENADTTIATVTPPRTEAEMASLEEKVELDVTQVEGVVKEGAPAETAAVDTEKKGGSKEEKKAPKAKE